MSRAMSRPDGPARRSSSLAWPANPVVQSTTTSPGFTSNASSTSSRSTGRCSPAFVLRRCFMASLLLHLEGVEQHPQVIERLEAQPPAVDRHVAVMIIGLALRLEPRRHRREVLQLPASAAGGDVPHAL